MTLLVLAPHALDEVLGCGGLLARLGDRPAQTLILFGDGEGRDGARRHAAAAVADLLTMRPPRFSGLAEGSGDTVPLHRLVSAIEAAVQEIRPTTVLIPSAATLHVDHRRTHEAAITALRPVPGHPVRRVLAYEILSSTDWVGPDWPAFRPHVFIDVADVLATKRRCLEYYAAEMRSPPHTRSIENVLRRAASLGGSVGLEAAEGFELVRRLVQRDEPL